MTSEEKKAFSNEAEKVLSHPMLVSVMEEYASNMGFRLEGLPAYGLRKVAFYAAVLARADALGVPVEALTMDEAEYQRFAARLVQALVSEP